MTRNYGNRMRLTMAMARKGKKFWMSRAFAGAHGQLKRAAKRSGKSYGELSHSKSKLTAKRARLALIAQRFNRRRKRQGG